MCDVVIVHIGNIFCRQLVVLEYSVVVVVKLIALLIVINCAALLVIVSTLQQVMGPDK